MGRSTRALTLWPGRQIIRAFPAPSRRASRHDWRRRPRCRTVSTIVSSPQVAGSCQIASIHTPLRHGGHMIPAVIGHLYDERHDDLTTRVWRVTRYMENIQGEDQQASRRDERGPGSVAR